MVKKVFKKDIPLLFAVIIVLILTTILISFTHAYVIDPLLNKPRVYPQNCTLLINCTADGIIFPRINCQGGYYGPECENRNFSSWYKKLD